MILSIIIPVFNEEKTVRNLLEKLNQVDLLHLGVHKEVIIVDDGSTDGTSKILKDCGEFFEILIQKENGGKGSAIRLGMEKATGDFIIIQDADLEYDPSEYALLLKPIISGETSVVFGSRFKNQKFFSKQRLALPSHYIGNKVISALFSLLFLSHLSDIETCYKCMTKNVLEHLRLKENDFCIEPELTAKILKAGYFIKEIPISYKFRSYAEGKKIGWKDGFKAIRAIFYYRFFN